MNERESDRLDAKIQRQREEEAADSDDPDYEHLVGETRSNESAEESISWSTPPQSPNTTGNLSSESEEEEISKPDAAEIERIVSRRPLTDEDWQYRVRWTGYGPQDDLW